MYKNRSKKREQYYEEVVRLHVEEGLSGRAIARVLPLGFPTVCRWLRNFAEEEGERNPSSRVMKKKQQGKPSGKSRVESRVERRVEQGTESEEIKALKRELSKTKKELAEERLRSRFYDRMIDIAEDKFKIEIRKKAGAKQ